MAESNGKVKFTVIPSSFASPTLKGRRRKGNLLECATFVALRVIGLRLCDDKKFVKMNYIHGTTCRGGAFNSCISLNISLTDQKLYITLK